MHAWWPPSAFRGMSAVAVFATAAFASPLASAQGYAAQWLMRITQAARTLNYSGTVLVRQGSRFDGAYRRSLQMTGLAQAFMGQPDQCAKVVGAALTSRVPRSRYLVGLDAQAMNLMDTLTPTAVKDRVMRLGLGI